MAKRPTSKDPIEESLMAAFERYVGPETPNDHFMIVEDEAGRFVQFLREPNLVVLDLPSNKLDKSRREIAERTIVTDWSGQKVELKNGHVSFQCWFVDEDVQGLADIVMAVFRDIYGAPLKTPPGITIGV